VSEEEKQFFKEVEEMTEEEFQSHIPSNEEVSKLKMVLSTEGHSKIMLRAPEHGETVYDFHWTFFIAREGTSFATSDNPCFTVSRDPRKHFSGLASDWSVTIFPLSPKVLLYIDNSRKTHNERFIPAPKSIAKYLNRLIVANSYDCVVAKDVNHLRSLVKNYKHRKHREGKTDEFGPYTFTRIE
jgi:hypothetical protein